MASLTCGGAVITFNGLKYLPQQLYSILNQTRMLSHLVISDDGSTDGTWAFLEAWAKQAPIRVTLIRNEQQLGLTANYQQAVSSVEADIIFSADQDDVWLPSKVEMQAAILEKSPEVLLVHSDAVLIDGNAKALGKTLFAALSIRPTEKIAIHSGNAFAVYCRRNLVTGATSAFRRSLLDIALPIGKHTYHDHWLALLASATGAIKMLETPTIQYRLHGGNMVGVDPNRSTHNLLMSMRQFRWDLNSTKPLSFSVNGNLEHHKMLHLRLSGIPQVPSHHLKTARKALSFANRRATMPANPVRRIVVVVRNIVAGRYHRFQAKPWVEVFRDILNR